VASLVMNGEVGKKREEDACLISNLNAMSRHSPRKTNVSLGISSRNSD
jgi:hypothetical protein